MSFHPVYFIYKNIKRLCYSKTHRNYKNYGEQGIKMHVDWQNNFLNFYNWAIEAGYKEGYKLKRTNLNLDFTPENCKWISGKTNKYKKYNLSSHPLYKKYYSIIKRCYKPNNKSFFWYGNKGIKVCDEWKNNFKNFYDWAIANGYKKGLTIDRLDSNDDYKPSNCCFITHSQNTIKANIKRWNKERD